MLLTKTRMPTGTLPKWFGRVRPKYRIPTNAILANLALSLTVGLIVGLLLNSTTWCRMPRSTRS